MEFLCNMKISVEAPRQKKNTSFNAQDVNVMDIQKHTVQNHMQSLRADETTTQPHVQNHQIRRPNVLCAEEIILQVTKDAKRTGTCKKPEASQSPLQQKESILPTVINSHLSNQTKHKIKCLSFHKPHTHKCSIKISNHLL
jgi:hypothetical protein